MTEFKTRCERFRTFEPPKYTVLCVNFPLEEEDFVYLLEREGTISCKEDEKQAMKRMSCAFLPDVAVMKYDTEADCKLHGSEGEGEFCRRT